MISYPAIIFEKYFSVSTPWRPFLNSNRDTTRLRKLKSVATIAKIFSCKAGAFLEREMQKQHFFGKDKPVAIAVNAEADPRWFRDIERFWKIIAVRRTFWKLRTLVKTIFNRDKNKYFSWLYNYCIYPVSLWLKAQSFSFSSSKFDVNLFEFVKIILQQKSKSVNFSIFSNLFSLFPGAKH